MKYKLIYLFICFFFDSRPKYLIKNKRNCTYVRKYDYFEYFGIFFTNCFDKIYEKIICEIHLKNSLQNFFLFLF